MDESHDEETIRCLRIGGDVVFKYCRTCGDPFCKIIINCWAPRMDIGQFLADNYTPEEIHKALNPEPGSGRLGKIISSIKPDKE